MTRNIPILMYHKIGLPTPRSTRRGLHVSPKALDSQLDYLTKLGYQFCDFNDLRNSQDNKTPLPEKPVFLTFDDGHSDNYTRGFPILEKYQAKATIFVIAGDMGRTNLVWDGAGERAPTDIMSWDQAREMHQSGVSIQSHGMTHGSFKNMPIEKIIAELEGSRKLIQQEIGEMPIALAYPRGVYNSQCMEAAGEAGYRFACTIEKGANDPDNLNLLALRRIAVKGYRWIHNRQFMRAASRGFE